MNKYPKFSPIKIRFYEELNDFLPAEKRKIRFEVNLPGRVSIKDFIESLGVPHTEIDLILVNGSSVNFNYILKEGDDISVYPEFESMDIADLQRLRPEPLRQPKFILDVHLGKLAKFMRILGYDTLYEMDYEDDQIVEISLEQKRTILTRDLGILKRGVVTHGYFVRNTEPEKQIVEILNRFQLENRIEMFSRCLECNSEIREIEKSKIVERIPPKVANHYDQFYYCDKCDKIYWKGSHYEKMRSVVSSLLKEKVNK